METPIILYVTYAIGILAFILMIVCIAMTIVSNHLSNRKQAKDVEYFRELPCGGDLYVMFRTINRDAKDKLTVNFVNAIIVKWYREDKVDIVCNEDQNNFVIKFKHGVKYDHKAEQMLYHTIMSFAGNDEQLSKSDLIKSFKFNLSTYQNFIDNISNYIPEIVYKYNITEERNHIMGLKKFIEDFSIIPELPTDEVFLRDRYIMFAVLVGVTDKIKDEFEAIIPFKITTFFKYINEMNNLMNSVDNFVDNIEI
jgi:hypothetical protein